MLLCDGQMRQENGHTNRNKTESAQQQHPERLRITPALTVTTMATPPRPPYVKGMVAASWLRGCNISVWSQQLKHLLHSGWSTDHVHVVQKCEEFLILKQLRLHGCPVDALFSTLSLMHVVHLAKIIVMGSSCHRPPCRASLEKWRLARKSYAPMPSTDKMTVSEFSLVNVTRSLPWVYRA